MWDIPKEGQVKRPPNLSPRKNPVRVSSKTAVICSNWELVIEIVRTKV
jgi:hypothetical protein